MNNEDKILSLLEGLVTRFDKLEDRFDKLEKEVSTIRADTFHIKTIQQEHTRMFLYVTDLLIYNDEEIDALKKKAN